jgi:hypothetical protein
LSGGEKSSAKGETALKNVLLICAAFMLVLGVVGCPGSQTPGEKDQAATGPSAQAAGANTASADNQQATTPDAAATGGSSLSASAPYKHAGASVPQNVNAGPFMIATQPAGKTPPKPSALISRADGTMMGPNDQLAAGTGPEGQGMNSAVPQKPKAAPPKPANQRK